MKTNKTQIFQNIEWPSGPVDRQLKYAQPDYVHIVRLTVTTTSTNVNRPII